MKNSDEAIDKVLAGLRATVPPEGLESRALAAVRRRAAMPRTSPLRWAALATGFTLTAAAVIALLAVQRHSPVPMVLRPQTQSTQLNRMPSALAEPTPTRARRHTPALRANAESPIANSKVASFPAPPLPLTEQERLLVELARRGEPEAVPVLDPDALAQQEARSEEVFESVLAAAQEPSIMKSKEDIP